MQRAPNEPDDALGLSPTEPRPACELTAAPREHDLRVGRADPPTPDSEPITGGAGHASFSPPAIGRADRKDQSWPVEPSNREPDRLGARQARGRGLSQPIPYQPRTSPNLVCRHSWLEIRAGSNSIGPELVDRTTN